MVRFVTVCGQGTVSLWETVWYQIAYFLSLIRPYTAAGLIIGLECVWHFLCTRILLKVVAIDHLSNSNSIFSIFENYFFLKHLVK